MIRTQYQEDNGRNSSLTLEVGVFLLEEDKFYSLTQKIPPPRERRDFDMLFDSFEAYDVQETRRISKEGSTLRLITQVCKKIQKQIPLAEIAEMLEEDISVIQPVYNIAVQSAPDYNEDAIFAKLHPELKESE